MLAESVLPRRERGWSRTPGRAWAGGGRAGRHWIVGAGSTPDFGVWPGIAGPTIAFAVRAWPTRLGLVSAGLGISLVPGFAADALPADVRWVPVRDDSGGLRRSLWAVTA